MTEVTDIAEINHTKALVRRGIITAPDGFMDEETSVLARLCNGCGAAGAKFDFVPDTMYGLCICWVCHIHDYGYHMGRTAEDKEREDHRFLTNLIELIEHESANWFMRYLRRRRALKYYEAVEAAGDAAFWGGKDDS